MCSSCENNSATPNKRRSGENTASSRKKNKTSNNNLTLRLTKEEKENQEKVDKIRDEINNRTSELHSSIQNGVMAIQSSPYYEMKVINPNNPNEEYYPHRYLYNNIILDLIQLKETTPHFILALMLCLTKDSKHSLEGDTTFESREAMDKCVSARLFGLVSDYFEKYFPDNDIDYGNDCKMKAFNARSFFCERQASSPSYCKQWTHDEAVARFYPISVLVGICEEWSIPILVLDLCGSGSSCARTQLKNLQKRYKCITCTVGSVHMACAITRYYPNTYDNEEEQCGQVTSQYENMDADVKTTHDISVARMKADQSVVLPEYKPLSEFLKDSSVATYVVHDVQEEVRKRTEERKRKAAEKEAQKEARRVEKQRKKDAKMIEDAKKEARREERQRKKIAEDAAKEARRVERESRKDAKEAEKEARRVESQRKKDVKAAALEAAAKLRREERERERERLRQPEEKTRRKNMTTDEILREKSMKKKEQLRKAKELKKKRLAKQDA